MREQIRSLKVDNKVLVSDLLNANQLVSELEVDLSRTRDRSEMLEALSRTMDEENKTLLAQTNRLLIQVLFVCLFVVVVVVIVVCVYRTRTS